MSKRKTQEAQEKLSILDIDAKIRSEFLKESSSIFEYESRVEDLESLLEKGDLSLRTRSNVEYNIIEARKKIASISANERYNFYISDTTELINAYKELMTEPVIISFVGNKITSTNDKRKREVASKYIEVASKYMSPEIKNLVENVNNQGVKIECNNCPNKKTFDIVDTNIYICTFCGSQQTVFIQTSPYKDSDRVNISTKYTYDRRIHFRDCINQYQGKQNTTIDQSIYNNLEQKFETHGLLVGNKNTPKKERFKNVEKHHVSMFLKEMDYGGNQYENVNLIFTTMTGKLLDDISQLEEDLMDDFDRFTEIYDRMIKDGSLKLERTSFINKHHLLYQFLLKRHHPCKQEDFPPLKTLGRQILHDDVCQPIFDELEWNYVPFLS